MRVHRLWDHLFRTGMFVVATACTSGPHVMPPSIAIAGRAPVPGAPSGVTAFVGVNVIPMDRERVLPQQTVLINDGWISALGPSSAVKVPAGAIRIDGRGKYLIPGLTACHEHQLLDTVVAEHRLFLYVANGVTTLRLMDRLNDNEVGRRARSLAAAGELLSPRLYISGAWGPLQYTNSAFPSLSPSRPRLDSIGAYVAAFKAAGYDFIKAYDESREIYDSLLAAARRLGVPVMGHVPRGGGRRQGEAPPEDAALLVRALEGGQASIEHLTGYIPALLKQSVPRKVKGTDLESPPAQRQLIDFARIPVLAGATARAGVWNCPTLTFMEMSSHELNRDTLSFWPEVEYVPPARREAWLTRARRPFHGTDYSSLPASEHNGTFEARRKLVKALQDSGAGLLLGTDLGYTDPENAPEFPYDAGMVAGVAVHRELHMFVRAGLTPYQALATGTRNSATFFRTFLGTPEETGTIAVGKRADLVLLRDNPLKDIRNTMQPAGVMLGGRWLSRAAIERRLAARWAAMATTP